MRSNSIIIPVCIAVLFSAGCSRYIASKDYTDPNAPGYTELNEASIPGQTADVSIMDTMPPDQEFTVREEIRRSYSINPGATVYLSRISGNVRVETAKIDRAEVLLVRLAKKKDDLAYHKFGAEQTAENLSIWAVSDRRSVFSAASNQIPDVRHRVFLRVPEKINLEVSRIEGELIAGRIEGRVKLRSIDGRVKVDRAFGQSELFGIQGEADVTFAPLNGRGIGVGAVSGNVTLRFEGEVNAELRVRGVNGAVNNQLGQVSGKEETSRSGWKTIQIGSGGPEIEIRGIDGNVSLLKAQD